MHRLIHDRNMKHAGMKGNIKHDKRETVLADMQKRKHDKNSTATVLYMVTITDRLHETCMKK